MQITINVDGRNLGRALRAAVPLALLCAVAYPVVTRAAQVGSLKTFSAGTTIRSSEVNANFVALRDAVNDNDSRIGNLSSLQTSAKSTLVAAVNETRAANKVVNVTVRKNSTRSSLGSNATEFVLESFTVDKKSPTSMLVIEGSFGAWGTGLAAFRQVWVYGTGAEELAQTTVYTLGPSQTNTAWATLSTLAVIQGHATTGPQTLQFKAKSAATSRPFLTYNPDANDDANLAGGTQAVYVVTEVEP